MPENALVFSFLRQHQTYIHSGEDGEGEGGMLYFADRESRLSLHQNAINNVLYPFKHFLPIELYFAASQNRRSRFGAEKRPFSREPSWSAPLQRIHCSTVSSIYALIKKSFFYTNRLNTTHKKQCNDAFIQRTYLYLWPFPRSAVSTTVISRHSASKHTSLRVPRREPRRRRLNSFACLL